MTTADREELEEAIRLRIQEKDHSGAATVALRGYRAEIFGFLLAFHRNQEDALEVFSLFSERLWLDLPSFKQKCSFRTWAYTLARHASLNYLRETRRRAKRQPALPEGSELSGLVAELRSETASFLRTERRMRFTALRESLPAEDQALLILRVDRKLSWNDLARVLREGASGLEEAELTREAARLRKRFQLLKTRLCELGRRAGVVSDDGQGSQTG